MTIEQTKPTTTTSLIIHGAILVALIAAAIVAPIGAIALVAYLVYLGVRYFRKRA